jgi:hypothetical protein
LPETHGSLSLQADRCGSVRPTFDITGPLRGNGKLFYRLTRACGGFLTEVIRVPVWISPTERAKI